MAAAARDEMRPPPGKIDGNSRIHPGRKGIDYCEKGKIHVVVHPETPMRIPYRKCNKGELLPEKMKRSRDNDTH